MKTRTLGKLPMELSEIALGTWGLATSAYGPSPAASQGKTTEQAFIEVVEHALTLGITTFDLAPLWGDGFAEETVAKVVGGKRDKVQYVTRAGAAWKRGRAVTRFEAYDLISDCEASLKRLNTDHIDVWLLHNPPDYVLAREDWMSTARRLKDDGKIRAWGVSVGDERHAKQAITAGADAVCLAYNALHADDLHGIANEVTMARTGILARSPLAYGLLAGKWNDAHTFGDKDHRQQRWSAHALRTRVKQVENLRFLVHDQVTSMAEAALRYVLANKLVTTAVVGARSMSHLDEAVRAAGHEVYLPSADVNKIPEAVISASR